MKSTFIILFSALTIMQPFTGLAWKVASGFSTDWAHVEVISVRLTEHVFYLHGSGANMCLFTGIDGNLLVDSEFPEMDAKIASAIARLAPGPVRYLIDTHWHGDHTGGNAFFGKAGTAIIAQKNVRARMMTPQFLAFFNAHIPAAPPEAWPRITFDHELTLHWNNDDVRLLHLVPAHTDGDTIVFMPHENVIHLGDIYINGLYPIIDLSSQGTIEGYFPILDQALALCNDETKIIPGHGPIASRHELQAYRDMLWTIRSRIKTMIGEGKSLAEITASNPSQEFDEAWASDRVGPKQLTKMIYESLTGPVEL